MTGCHRVRWALPGYSKQTSAQTVAKVWFPPLSRRERPKPDIRASCSISACRMAASRNKRAIRQRSTNGGYQENADLTCSTVRLSMRAIQYDYRLRLATKLTLGFGQFFQSLSPQYVLIGPSRLSHSLLMRPLQFWGACRRPEGSHRVGRPPDRP